MLDRVAPEDHAAVGKALAEAVDRGGLMSVDFRGLRAKGARPWLRVQAKSYVRPGARPRLIGVVQDISAQRQSEIALRQAAAVFSTTKEAIFIADARLRLVAANQAFSTITGHAAVDVIGRRIDEWLLHAPEATHGSRKAPPGTGAFFSMVGAIPGLSGWANRMRPIPIPVLCEAFLSVLRSPRDGVILEGEALWAAGSNFG